MGVMLSFMQADNLPIHVDPSTICAAVFVGLEPRCDRVMVEGIRDPIELRHDPGGPVTSIEGVRAVLEEAHRHPFAVFPIQGGTLLPQTALVSARPVAMRTCSDGGTLLCFKGHTLWIPTMQTYLDAVQTRTHELVARQRLNVPPIKAPPKW